MKMYLPTALVAFTLGCGGAEPPGGVATAEIVVGLTTHDTAVAPAPRDFGVLWVGQRPDQLAFLTSAAVLDTSPSGVRLRTVAPPAGALIPTFEAYARLAPTADGAEWTDPVASTIGYGLVVALDHAASGPVEPEDVVGLVEDAVVVYAPAAVAPGSLDEAIFGPLGAGLHLLKAERDESACYALGDSGWCGLRFTRPAEQFQAPLTLRLGDPRTLRYPTWTL